MFVQYGCGMTPATGWRNFDSSPTLAFERVPVLGRLYTKNATRFPDAVEYGDIVKGLPVADGSCDAIYCSHVLEHLALRDLRAALRNTHRILKPSGLFRLVMPDLEHLAEKYISSEMDDACSTFMVDAHLGWAERPRGLLGFARMWLGSSLHLWLWDFKGIAVELRDAGFRDIRRAQYGDSTQPAFCTAESPGRWENSLGVECRR